MRLPSGEKGVVALHASTFILGEVDRVLREEVGWEKDRAERAVAQIRRVAGEYTNRRSRWSPRPRTTRRKTGSSSVPSLQIQNSSQLGTRSICCPSASSEAHLPLG